MLLGYSKQVLQKLQKLFWSDLSACVDMWNISMDLQCAAKEELPVAYVR